MRVLAVTNMYPTASAPWSGTFVEQQVEGLRRLGLSVEILLLDRPHGAGAVTAPTLLFLKGAVRAYRGAIKRIRRCAAELKPDLMHVMYGGVTAELATRAVSGLPIVVSFCGGDLLREPAPTAAKRLSIRYGVFASHLAARRADAIVVKSRNLREALPPGIDRRRVWTIPNGVDLERFKPMDPRACRERLGWPEGTFHVLFPSFPEDPRKGFALARAAVERLKTSGIEIELHTLRGRPHEEVPIWLNAGHCLLFASSLEGSPNIVKEALACDRAVVSVDIGDVRERLDGIAGCFLADAAADDLAAKLRLALPESPTEDRRVAGRTRMRELSLERVAERVLAVYREVVGARGRSGVTAR